MKRPTLLLFSMVFLLGAQASLEAQAQSSFNHYAISQTRVIHTNLNRAPRRWPGPEVIVEKIKANISIDAHVAVTQLTYDLKNPSPRQINAELLIPVPDGSVLRGFTFQGNSKEVEFKILPVQEARQIYDRIVAASNDPALLEFVGLNLLKSSVFPVAANGTQKVQVTYEQLLTKNGNRVDYILPRSESIDYRVPWEISLSVKSPESISTSYSPSHNIETRVIDPKKLHVRLNKNGKIQPGSFRFSYLLEEGDITASLLAYPDPKVGGGYFLLMAGLPTEIEGLKKKKLKREVTLVLDRSGSMSGEKIDQVKSAALQVISGLDEGEAFNLLVYNESVDVFSSESVFKNKETTLRAQKYLETISARGGTNIHDALVEALRRKPREDVLPIVLFLTDGLPTIGQTREDLIRELASKHNPFKRRIFTFGVGSDVNTPLLEALAYKSRGVTTFVAPHEDVELKVADVFRRLAGPIFSEPQLELVDAQGKPALHRVRDLIPGDIPDLFKGDQLIVLGKYLEDKPLSFRVKGNFLGEERSYQFTFSLDQSSTKNAFVPRLWASRKIGMLEDAIRHSTTITGLANFNHQNNPTLTDPRLKEIIDEIVKLSTEFGILSEYTAFFAQEGTDLTKKDLVLAEVGGNFLRRSISCRSGLGSWNQDINRQRVKSQKVLNFGNNYINSKLKEVEIVSVQQICDRAFFKRGNRWVDSRLVNDPKKDMNARIVDIGSVAYAALISQLAEQGRQGCLSLSGDIFLMVGSERVLIRGSKAEIKKPAPDQQESSAPSSASPSSSIQKQH